MLSFILGLSGFGATSFLSLVSLQHAWIVYVAICVQGIAGLLFGLRAPREINDAKWHMSPLLAYVGVFAGVGNILLSYLLVLQISDVSSSQLP